MFYVFHCSFLFSFYNNIFVVGFCKPYEVTCRNKEQCVPQSWWCDGSPDCRDKSDEANCRKEHIF